MAQLILERVGAAIGSRVFSGALGALGATLGRAAGRYLGGRLDRALFGTTRHVDGPRLTDVHLQGSTEGASIPAVYGRVRIAGQMIWAARYKEHVSVERRSTGGKGGLARTTAVDETTYSYTLSFAVGLCEGPAARMSRAWANGEPLDLSTLNWRFHPGTEDQAADPVIEAVEGAANAPAYRGLCYVVFEDMPLDQFGNAPPQLSFELIRPVPSAGPARLEEMAQGVCLIPGAGEFVYATEVIRRNVGPGADIAENMHAEAERANLKVSLDQLQSDLPQCRSVLLVVAWFGADLRCGVCEIKPGVELAEKTTRPRIWRAGGVDRAGGHLISQVGGAPAFGGTPSDASVVQAIQELKARGFKVGLYPFILMDAPADNALPDPYGGAAQAAYPWRGRITCHPAAGRAGSPDKTAAAASQVAAFFGTASVSDFSIAGDEVAYAGPAEWSLRRFILHNAKLAAAAGGVDAFVLGSELRGVTTVRSSATAYPAVAALKTLANDVRSVLGAATTLTYAADWSEYFGHQPQDGSGDVFFHLDPLWADAAVDCIGVDWYPPLADWRDGAGHADASLARTPYDPAYLAARIEAGEDYDWYYADDVARAAQTRTPITDGAYAKPWVFRAKDLRNWWANAHYDRPGGIESASPTEWTPQSKPIWLVELGCPAIDKGANAPNLFVDPKSAESARPPFSSGAPDDLIQRRMLEAYLCYWSGPANPTSAVYGGPMIDPAGVHLWAWDARPFALFPTRRDLWADGANWRLGHWLNGRAGAGGLSEVVADLCRRAGVTDAATGGLTGIVPGYIVDSPAEARAAIEPLARVFAFDAREHEGAIVFEHDVEGDAAMLSLDTLVEAPDGRAAITRDDGADAPCEARVRFLDPERDYRVAMVSARQRDAAGAGVETVDAPLCLSVEAAEAAAQAILAKARAEIETLSVALAPSQLAVEPGDGATLAAPGAPESFRVARIEEGPTREALLSRRAPAAAAATVFAPAPAAAPLTAAPSAPDFVLLDLPPIPGAEDDDRPLFAALAAPWSGPVDFYAGEAAETATWRGRAEFPAIMGALQWDLWPGPVGRWDEGNVVRVSLSGADLASVTDDALFAGANTFAIEQADGGWEILQARDIELVSAGTYDLRRLLRGQLGTEGAIGAPAASGARIVKIDPRLARVSIASHEIGAPLAWIAVAAPLAPTDPAGAAVGSVWSRVWARPFSPAHVAGWRLAGGDVALSWIRRTRIGGDAWGQPDVPLSEEREAYQVEILSGGTAIRVIETDQPAATYAASDQIADFGAPPSALTVRVAQISSTYGPGTRTESTISL
jgi:hypothetical protein